MFSFPRGSCTISLTAFAALTPGWDTCWGLRWVRSAARAVSGAPTGPPCEGRGGRRRPGAAVSGTAVRLRDPSWRPAPSRINARSPAFDPERTETIRTVLPRSDPATRSLSPGRRVRAGAALPAGPRPRPAPPGALPARRPRPPLEEPGAAAPPRPFLLPLPCRSPARRMTRSPPRALRHRVAFPRGAPSRPRCCEGSVLPPAPPALPRPRLRTAEPSACLGLISRATGDSRRLLCVSSPSQIDTTVRWE